MKFHATLTASGVHFPTDYARARFLDYAKKHVGDRIELVAGVESRKARGYLEAAVIPSYCKHQYGLDPRTADPGAMRHLFKSDFHFEVVKDRQGRLRRMPKPSQGQAAALANRYTEWAVENGFPVPNPALWKEWNDRFRGEHPDYWDWLALLGLEEDAGPSQVPEEEKGDIPEYPDADADGKTAFD